MGMVIELAQIVAPRILIGQVKMIKNHRREGADKKLDYHKALKGAFYVFTRAKRESYTVV